jgi:hypothetical protein
MAKTFKLNQKVFYDRSEGVYLGPAPTALKQSHFQDHLVQGGYINWIIRRSGRLRLKDHLEREVIVAPVHLAKLSPKTGRLVLDRFVGYTQVNQMYDTTPVKGNYWMAI